MSGEDLADELTGGLDDWLNALPAYQREHLARMLDRTDPEEVAIAWLSASGPADNAPFGGVRSGAVLFYEKLLEQIEILICTDEGYQEERASLLREARVGRAAFVTGTAMVVAPVVGASPVVIAPAIAVIYALLSKAGKEALCESLRSMIQRRRDEVED